MAIGTLISMPSIVGSVSQAASISNSIQGSPTPKSSPRLQFWHDFFLFQYAGTVKFLGTNEITDHVMEDASVSHDHVAVKPLKITIEGVCGSISMTRAQINGGVLGSMQNLVGSIPAYAGQYAAGVASTMSSAISQAQAISGQINSVIAQGRALQRFAGLALSPMQEAFKKLEGLRQSGTPFAILLPFSRDAFQDMIIESLSAEEPESSKSIMNFMVTLKQIRTVSRVAGVSVRKMDPSTMSQNAVKKLLGVTSGIPIPAGIPRLAAAFGVTI